MRHEEVILYNYKPLKDQSIEHLLDILERNSLYFCHGKLLNDPFEGTIIGDKTTQNLFQNSAILSLSRTNDNLLMWSHYANSHYGFCFGFDQLKLLESINKDLEKLTEPFLSHGYVLYSDTPPSVKKQFAEIDAKDVIYNKSIGWSYEQEYRFVVSTPRKILLVQESLTEVTIGASVPIWNEMYDSIWDAIKKLPENVKVRVLRLSQTHYGVELADEFAPSQLDSRIQAMITKRGYR